MQVSSVCRSTEMVLFSFNFNMQVNSLTEYKYLVIIY